MKTFISAIDVERLKHNARQNEALWIGYFVTGDFNPPGALIPVWPTNPHITVAHLGRQCSDQIVDRIADALNENGAHLVAGELTGAGYFWRKNPTPIILVNSAALFMGRAHLLLKLAKHQVPYDERFGFIPHITLTTDANDHQWRWMQGDSARITLQLGIKCGDTKVLL